MLTKIQEQAKSLLPDFSVDNVEYFTVFVAGIAKLHSYTEFSINPGSNPLTAVLFFYGTEKHAWDCIHFSDGIGIYQINNHGTFIIL